MAAGNPGIPTPRKAEHGIPVLVRHAKVRSWKAFERVGVAFTLESDGKSYHLFETGRGENGLWVDDKSRTASFPGDATARTIAECIMERIIRRCDLG